jgi:L-2-hydroxyglutarate oxidase
VIHSGIYYTPGSLKARFAREGNQSMVEFCRDHGIPHEVCGKVVVAVEEKELPILENLFQRGLQNQLKVEKLSAGQVREIEPHVHCLAGIKVPSTGITDFAKVCAKYAELIQKMGGTPEIGRQS